MAPEPVSLGVAPAGDPGVPMPDEVAAQPALEPARGLGQGDERAERAARSLESLARRVRAGELRLAPEVSAASDVAILAGLLAAILSSPAASAAAEAVPTSPVGGGDREVWGGEAR